MLKTAIKLMCLIIYSLGIAVSIAASAGAADKTDVYDTVVLKNSDKVTGTVLNDTFTIMTPYTNVALKRDDISEIKIDFEHENNDVITLDTGGLMEGTIEETVLSVKLVSGKIISLEKKACKNITLYKKR